MADYQNPNNPNDPMFNSEMPPPPGYGMPPGGMPMDDSEMDSGMPTVAAAPGRVLVVLLGGVLIIGTVLYLLFGGESDAPVTADAPIINSRNNTPATSPSIPAPPVSIPEPPQTTVPTLPPPPPPVAPPAPPAPITAKVDAAQLSKVQQERRASSMLVHGGGRGAARVSNTEATGFNGTDPNLVFSREYLKGTGAAQAEATLMGNMNYIVAEGKVIDAILETAINTDLPGPLRAVVSRDVYAESGKEIMVPKGSRLVGSYNTGVQRGQSRVYVVWRRIIRPDGIDINIDSPGIDSLGRAGVGGYVDNKYFEMFAASLLTSSVSIGLGIAADNMLDESGTSQTNTSDGTTTSSGSAGSQAVLEGIRDFSDTSEQILRGILEQEPTITVDQGTRIKVFVNRDLIMPSSVLEQTRFIQ